MYKDYFQFNREPFSIAPDPRFLFMSDKHKEALAHLLYGIQSSGAFVVLTGEVGSGKTTVCRCFLEQIPEHVDIAFILNPKLEVIELLASICDELGVNYAEHATVKTLVDALNRFLLENHAKGRSTLVIIEEAQNLSEEVLEQLRLLTNLETNEKKLLQIVLLAQPEFLDILNQESMKQLAQRVTARFHLKTLSAKETEQYILHRLSIAGSKFDPFPKNIKKDIYRISGGVPRVINLIADRALLGAYASNLHLVNKSILKKAAHELQGEKSISRKNSFNIAMLFAFLLLLLIIGLSILFKPVVMENTIFSNTWLNDNPGIKQNVNTTLKNKQSYDFELALDEPREAYSFPESELHVFLNDFTSAAYSLAELWGFPSESYEAIDGPNSFCQFALKNGMRCFNDQANMGLLLKLGRPAILKLISEQGDRYYAVLLGVKDQQLLLKYSEGQQLVSFHEMEKLWLGEFYTWVSVPSTWKGQVLNVDDKSLLVYWVQDSLNLLGYPQGKQTGVYTQQMSDQIKALQSEAGIIPDGKIGLKTIMYINTISNNDIPRLQGVFSRTRQGN